MRDDIQLQEHDQRLRFSVAGGLSEILALEGLAKEALAESRFSWAKFLRKISGMAVERRSAKIQKEQQMGAEAYMEPKPYGTLRLFFVLIGYTLLVNFGLSFIAGIIYASDWFQVIAAGEPTDFTTPKVRFESMILAVNIINWFSAFPAILASAVAYWKLSDWTAKGNRQIFWIIVGAPLAGFLIFRFYRAFYLNEFSVFDIRFTFTLHTIIPNILITLFIIWFSARKFDQHGNKKEYPE